MECLVCADQKQNVDVCKGEQCMYTMCSDCLKKYGRSTCPACQRNGCFVVPVKKQDCMPFNMVFILLLITVLGGAYAIGALFCIFVLNEPMSLMTLLYGYGIFAVTSWVCLVFAVMCSNRIPFANRIVALILE